MDFLVRITMNGPTGLDEASEKELFLKEREYGIEHVGSGMISQIWSLPGKIGNVSIWTVKDAEELNANLRALPLFKYFDIDVTALATHPLKAKG